MGVFEATIANFNYIPEAIEHPECMFKGGKICRYVLRWRLTKSARIKRARNVSMLSLPLLNIPALVFDPLSLLATVPLSLATYAILDRETTKAELAEITNSIEHLTASRDQLMEQLEQNYNNAMLTSEVGYAISSLDSIDRVLKSVVNVLGKRLDFDRGMILLANENRTRLTYRAGFGHIDEHRFILERASFRLDNPDSRGIFVEAFKQQKPFLVDDFEAFERRHTTHSINVAKALGVKSFVCCPIVCEGETVGVLAVDNLKKAEDMFREMGMDYWLVKTRKGLSSLSENAQ